MDYINDAKILVNYVDRLKTAGINMAKSYSDGKNPPEDIGILSDSLEEWKSDTSYKKNQLFSYKGNAGFVKQDHTSQKTWVPFESGTEALYGARPTPDKYGIYPYIYNMSAKVDMIVKDPNGSNYICIQDISDMLYPPSSIAAHFKEV